MKQIFGRTPKIPVKSLDILSNPLRVSLNFIGLGGVGGGHGMGGLGGVTGGPLDCGISTSYMGFTFKIHLQHR